MQDTRVLVRSKRKKLLTVCQEADQLGALLGGLPGEVCQHRIISFCRLSPAGFIRFVAEHTRIREMSVATFRIGPRALKLLGDLYAQGRLNRARFVLGRLVASRHKGNNERDYWDRLVAMCQRNGWTACSIANHTKVVLFDTEDGYFVLEGSGNLNEAPNWEQYCFEQDEELYRFYYDVINKMFSFAAGQEPEAEQEETPELEGGEGLWQDQDRPPLW